MKGQQASRLENKMSEKCHFGFRKTSERNERKEAYYAYVIGFL